MPLFLGIKLYIEIKGGNTMAIYKCTVCGYSYDESEKEKQWDELKDGWKCPVCGSPKKKFKRVESELEYSAEKTRGHDSVEEHMDIIHKMATTGEMIIEPMRTRHQVTSWEDILIKGAQLGKFPLDEDGYVSTKTVIGRKAEKPMELETPIIVTHMSFGALSRELKVSLAKGSARNRGAIGSGEGGILPEEMDSAHKYIFEYVPNKYSVNDENLKKADAIEVKVGQGTKPGMGGLLPGEKVTAEIAKVRGKEENKDIVSPSRFEGINSPEDLKNLIEELRKRSGGRPIGVKIAAGHIEADLEFILKAGADFVTIDGRGGGTAASHKIVKDSTSVPTIYALSRARKYLDEAGSDIQLIITGGLRISSDFAKAIAMGADAVAIGTAALMAAGCQQYRVCHSGNCPTGCTTQDKELRKNIVVDQSAERVYNFIKLSTEELRIFSRICGCSDVHQIGKEDLCTVSSEISNNTEIEHA